MTTDIKDCKAFIDNGRIKIVDDTGVEYDDLIGRQKTKAHMYFYFSMISFALFITSLVITFSPLFWTDLSKGQIILFCVLDLVLGITFWGFIDSKTNYQQLSHRNNDEYNLAKNYLQPKIMQLQKELCTHETEMQNIRNQGKFDFKKQVEMSA